MKNVTADEVRAAMIAADITRVVTRACSMCGYVMAYLREGDALLYDPGCYCTSGDGLEPRSWDDAAALINMQSDPKWRAKIAAEFGIATPAPERGT